MLPSFRWADFKNFIKNKNSPCQPIPSRMKRAILIENFHRCFLPSFSSLGQAVSEEKIIRNRTNRNKNFLWQPRLLTNRNDMSNLYRGSSIDASYFYHVLVHLAKWFQRRIFRNRPTRNKNCLWWPKWVIHIEDLLYMHPTKFWFILPRDFRGEDSNLKS